jgi:hypothetical protein
MKSRINFLLCSILVLLASSLSHAQELKLQGKWVMTYDPDGPVAKEWIRFYKNGTVEFGDEKGIFLYCTYDGTTDSIFSTCNVRGEEKMMSFIVKNNFRELMNPSGAVYTRKGK